ncbi:protein DETOXIFICATION 29-like [Zingiber officinale]|uniref:protein DETOXIFICATION 29-like n=1 Tax=Zingiber officinale TaxID=94328 RepID=UPI001C4BC884|nr:protein DETOXIFICATION 29-like [Zingiber officinale]
MNWRIMVGRLLSKICEESKQTWRLAGAAILTGLFQFSIAMVTAAFVGHLGALQLSAISVAQGVIAGFAYGAMLGMGSALETLCGQAAGAGQLQMLGIYMQRSWVISLTTATLLTPLYLFSAPILRLLRQSQSVSHVAGKYCRWILPQLFAFAINFPLQKFFQSQSKVWVITAISGAVLGIHALLNWVFVVKLDYGLLGAAMVENVSWWLIDLAQIVYLVSGFFPEAWRGFSTLAFRNLGAFVRLSLASAIMLCMELWYYTAIIILVGCLKNPEIAISAISICINYASWALMIALGFNAAVSVRVSNELGANRPKAAKFSVIIAVSTSALLGLLFTATTLIFRKQLPKLFTDDPEVIRKTSKLGYLLSATIALNSMQPVLSGVAIGAGWQSLVAFINTACYYLFGLPIGAVLGFKLFKLNEIGIWTGMLIGTLAQTVVLVVIIWRTKWQKEALQAEERVRTWGGRIGPPSP